MVGRGNRSKKQTEPGKRQLKSAREEKSGNLNARHTHAPIFLRTSLGAHTHLQLLLLLLPDTDTDTAAYVHRQVGSHCRWFAGRRVREKALWRRAKFNGVVFCAHICRPLVGERQLLCAAKRFAYIDTEFKKKIFSKPLRRTSKKMYSQNWVQLLATIRSRSRQLFKQMHRHTHIHPHRTIQILLTSFAQPHQPFWFTGFTFQKRSAKHV